MHFLEQSTDIMNKLYIISLWIKGHGRIQNYQNMYPKLAEVIQILMLISSMLQLQLWKTQNAGSVLVAPIQAKYAS